jgi:hypothetical protein
MSLKLGDDIVKLYTQYRNKSDLIKTVTIGTNKFEVDSRYEISQISTCWVRF